MEQSMTLVKRGQITEQVVELPILRQVYDTIDSEGPKGLTNNKIVQVVDNLASMGDFNNIHDNENVAVVTEPSKFTCEQEEKSLIKPELRRRLGVLRRKKLQRWIRRPWNVV